MAGAEGQRCRAAQPQRAARTCTSAVSLSLPSALAQKPLMTWGGWRAAGRGQARPGGSPRGLEQGGAGGSALLQQPSHRSGARARAATSLRARRRRSLRCAPRPVARRRLPPRYYCGSSERPRTCRPSWQSCLSSWSAIAAAPVAARPIRGIQRLRWTSHGLDSSLRKRRRRQGRDARGLGFLARCGRCSGARGALDSRGQRGLNNRPAGKRGTMRGSGGGKGKWRKQGCIVSILRSAIWLRRREVQSDTQAATAATRTPAKNPGTAQQPPVMYITIHNTGRSHNNNNNRAPHAVKSESVPSSCAAATVAAPPPPPPPPPASTATAFTGAREPQVSAG